MGLFRRNRVVRPEGASLHPEFDYVGMDAEKPRPPRVDPRAALLRLTAEAIIMQDEAAEIIAGVRARQSLGLLAPRSGPLVHRFFGLRDTLAPHYDDPDLERMRAVLDVVLHHDALLLSTSVELLAYEWRSERLSQQIDSLDGLGTPGRWLEEVYAELAATPAAAGPHTYALPA